MTLTMPSDASNVKLASTVSLQLVEPITHLLIALLATIVKRELHSPSLLHALKEHTVTRKARPKALNAQLAPTASIVLKALLTLKFVLWALSAM